MQVLIIEDNHGIASDLSSYLLTKGHFVDAAGCDFLGRNLAWVGQYDAIVLDLMLDGIDGIELCRKLREEGSSATPILMISASDSSDEKFAGMEAGADDFLFRPVTLREIESRLRVLFRLSSGGKVNMSQNASFAK